jgi:hypothetical protein
VKIQQQESYPYIVLKSQKKSLITYPFLIFLISIAVILLLTVNDLHAQSLQGRIADAIDRIIIVLNLLIVGAIAWTGFLLAKGEQHAVSRLIYCVVALIVVNSARLVVDFFLF